MKCFKVFLFQASCQSANVTCNCECICPSPATTLPTPYPSPKVPTGSPSTTTNGLAAALSKTMFYVGASGEFGAPGPRYYNCTSVHCTVYFRAQESKNFEDAQVNPSFIVFVFVVTPYNHRTYYNELLKSGRQVKDSFYAYVGEGGSF